MGETEPIGDRENSVLSDPEGVASVEGRLGEWLDLTRLSPGRLRTPCYKGVGK